eukprot:g3041.t1
MIFGLSGQLKTAAAKIEIQWFSKQTICFHSSTLHPSSFLPADTKSRYMSAMASTTASMQKVSISNATNGPDNDEMKGSSTSTTGGTGDKTSSSSSSTESNATSTDYYFDSYSHFGIHEEMLKDEVRTLSYKRAILDNKHLFKDKIVLDVGCGTGILSMFAAEAGAKKVYAVECSGIANQARKIIKANGLDNIITLVQGKIEDLELPDLPVDDANGIKQVDIIISEWMGYFLLYESMLNSVIHARDKWLKPKTGIILPDKSSLFLACIEDAEYMEEKIHYWENVYGYKMGCIKELAMLEPLVDEVPEDNVCSEVCKVCTIDCMTVTLDELKFKLPYSIKMNRADFVHAVVGWFDIEFSYSHNPSKCYFSTGPFDTQTHWKQTVMYLNNPKIPLVAQIGDKLEGEIYVRPNAKNHRDIDITMHYKFEKADIDFVQEYRLR